MGKTLDLVQSELERAEVEGPEKLIERVRAWRLKLLGYSIIDIAEELGVSFGTAQADVKWCINNLPVAFESADEFRRVSLPQLEEQYRRLLDMSTETSHRVAAGIKDMQAKLLGAYAPTKIDANVHASYSIVGVNEEEI